MIIKNSNNNNRNKNNINSNMIRKTKQRKCQKRQTATSATNKQGESNANRTHDLVVWGAAPAMKKHIESKAQLLQNRKLLQFFPQLRDVSFQISKHLQIAWKLEIRGPNCCNNIDNGRFRLRNFFFLLLGFLGSWLHWGFIVACWIVAFIGTSWLLGLFPRNIHFKEAQQRSCNSVNKQQHQLRRTTGMAMTKDKKHHKKINTCRTTTFALLHSKVVPSNCCFRYFKKAKMLQVHCK